MKRTKGASLNLVSLMDIFTILVFFLMVNSSEVEVLQTNSKIKLPDSISEQRPENQLMITVSDTDIMVLGRPVAKVATLRANERGSIATITRLEEELRHQAERKGEVPEGGFEITIMGDHEIPYWLLKKIILTCQTTDFVRVSLAVNKLEAGDDSVGGGADLAVSPDVAGVAS
jgi:biopolymer transport protein ExbD